MLSCPIESSREWQAILKKANNDRTEALRLWVEQGFSENEDLNEYISEENFDEERETNPVNEEDTEADFSKLVDRIRIYLKKQYEILQQKNIPDQKSKTARLKEIIDTVDTLDGVESINLFINDAHKKALQVKKKFSALLANKDQFTRKEIIDQLAAISDFANSYSILDEISSKDIQDYFTMDSASENMPGPVTPQKMLAEAISIRDKVKKKVLTEGIPLLAEYLVEQKSGYSEANLNSELEAAKKELAEVEADPKLSAKRKAKRIKNLNDRIKLFSGFDVDVKSMTDLLKQAIKDEGAIDYFISPLITSSDSALALFAKSVKSQLEFARMQDIKVRDTLVESFKKYKSTTSAPVDNTAKFNEGIYDIVERKFKDPETGEITTTQQAQFVQKYDMQKFYEAKRSFFESLGEKPQPVGEKPTKEEKALINAWYAKRAAWYRNNTSPKSDTDIQKILSQKEKEKNAKYITEEEYQDWMKSVISYDKDGSIIYKGELSQPANHYINTKWSAMYDVNDQPKNEKGRYHRTLLDLYFDAQSKLPVSQQRGFILPSIDKTTLERIMQNGLKDAGITAFKEGTSMRSYDTEFGLASLSEEGVRILPVYFTQNMDAKDVSLDLASSVLLFSQMANKYEALNKINGEITLMKNIMGEREVPITNSKGQGVLDAFANKLGYTEFIRQNKESFSKRHFDAFLDMVVYGEMQKAEEILGFSFGKITNTALGYSAITSIAADLLKGVANNLQGNIQLIIETAGAQYFNGKNLRKGKAYLAKNLANVLADFGKHSPTSLLGKLVELYDPLQGNFKDQYGKKVSKSVANKLFRTDTLFFNQHFGEYEIQVSTMLALFDNTKVFDKTANKEITLLEAYNLYGVDLTDKIEIAKLDKTGEPEKDESGNIIYLPFGEKQRQDIQNRLHGLSKYMHGVYNDFDKGTVQKYSLGRLAMMYRKHVVPAYKRRVKRASMDHEIGDVTEGYYRVFTNTVLKDLRDYKVNIIKNWSTYTPYQKAHIRKVLAEMSIIASLAVLISILKAIADDDDDLEQAIKENYMYNFVLYEAVRMRSETASYINPKDAYRVIKSPSAMTTTIERLIKFIDQFMIQSWSDEDSVFKRDTGVWNKGDNKSWAYFLKLMGYSGYNVDPAEAVKSFQSTFVK